jgi:hypothetical protein
VLPDLKRFALEEPEDVIDTTPLDKQTMNLKIATTVEELKKKLQKA